jgi:hypothetical protein
MPWSAARLDITYAPSAAAEIFWCFLFKNSICFEKFWNSKGRNNSIERSNTKLGWKNAENWPWVSKIFENLVFIYYIAVTAAGFFLKNQQRLARLTPLLVTTFLLFLNITSQFNMVKSLYLHSGKYGDRSCKLEFRTCPLRSQ